MEEAAAAVIREPVSPCGGDLASTTVQSDSGPSIELEGPSEPVKIPPTLSVNEDAPSSEAQETFPDGLLPLMVAVAAGVISPYDEEQGAPSSPETAAAAAAAAEGAPRLLECIFSPHPAQALAAADPKDLMYLHQHEAHNLLLRHAVRAEHDDKETFQLLQLLVLQPMQLQQDNHSRMFELFELMVPTHDCIFAFRELFMYYLKLHCANYNEPIHLAACCGRTSAVLQLLELGVPLDAPDRFRRTAAFHAASNGHAMLLRALAAMGADLTVLDADGISLLQEATARRRIRDGRDREEIVQFLVQQNARNRPKRDRA
ncbi:ankyrin repeat-containing protein [Cyclospora cayetanensis]|uniref:Ankyrin repeat-containing protein n=1 Tax=Cyclospora cayetanensis TaxID=88456 RepID=A0A1D3CR42_9EIME|nr:ankyrin repeat-containing protein [Cyclospora cayetanensis]